MSDIERYEQALRNRDAGKATLGDAVAIARGRPGPPTIPICFDSPDFGNCKDCGQPLIMLRAREPHEVRHKLIAACMQCDVVQVKPVSGDA